jgi:hypothetical protein
VIIEDIERILIDLLKQLQHKYRLIATNYSKRDHLIDDDTNDTCCDNNNEMEQTKERTQNEQSSKKRTSAHHSISALHSTQTFSLRLPLPLSLPLARSTSSTSTSTSAATTSTPTSDYRIQVHSLVKNNSITNSVCHDNGNKKMKSTRYNTAHTAAAAAAATADGIDDNGKNGRGKGEDDHKKVAGRDKRKHNDTIMMNSDCNDKEWNVKISFPTKSGTELGKYDWHIHMLQSSPNAHLIGVTSNEPKFED